MANRAGRTRTLWAVGGGAFGLVASALLIGLGRAQSIAFSDHERGASELKWQAAALVVIVVGGWILSSGLHRHHLAIWRRIKSRSATVEPPSPAPKPTLPPSKPAAGKAQSSSQRQP
jgi:hypothetical protein